MQPKIRKSLLRVYDLLLSTEADAGLRRSIRITVRKLKSQKFDLDDGEIAKIIRKQCTKIKNAGLKTKLQYTADILSQDSSSGSDDSSDSTCYFELERIIGMRIKHGSREYLARWSGYGSDEDTWEPYAKLLDDDCGDLVAKFHKEASRVV